MAIGLPVEALQHHPGVVEGGRGWGWWGWVGWDGADWSGLVHRRGEQQQRQRDWGGDEGVQGPAPPEETTECLHWLHKAVILAGSVAASSATPSGLNLG